MSENEPILEKEELLKVYSIAKKNLMEDRRKSPAKLRKMQDAFMKAGLAWEDVDVTNTSTVFSQRDNDMSSPMAFQKRRR